MKTTYNMYGQVCKVTRGDDEWVTYISSMSGNTVTITRQEHDRRISMWGPILPTDTLQRLSDAYKARKEEGGLFVHTCASKGDGANPVTKPSHYQIFEGVEAIEVIASSMSEEAFRGYCLGNFLKYRMRAGNKDKLQQDIDKSNFYKELFDKHKHNCRG